MKTLTPLTALLGLFLALSAYADLVRGMEHNARFK